MLCVAEVREVFAQVLSDLQIPYTRVPVETGLHSCPWLPAHLQGFYTQVEKDALDSITVFTRYGIRSVGVCSEKTSLKSGLEEAPYVNLVLGERYINNIVHKNHAYTIFST